ncbi:MAG TPA: 6-pyruvoyl-tetrahydropterin synthase-related protein [Terriglobales bacterium]|nr:6-pyruvoyl-tetrahydropterin synthase-related protein [Terriglobales bacterium]
MAKGQKDAAGSRWIATLVLAATALLCVLPFAWKGDPSGHDFEFHLSSWMEVAHQWSQGIAYPRWAALAHFGYGEARFIFYPPLSWLLGAALGTVMPWTFTPAVYVWVVLTVGGWCMYRLAREWLSEHDAIAAAMLYVVNPYHVVVVYWRSAYAELLADAFFPLLLLWVVRWRDRPRRAVVPLSLTLGAIWLSNAPAAVIATYSVVLLAVVIWAVDRDWRVFACAVVAIALALALAAFYIIPAAWEQKWVNIGEILSPGVRPAENFLFTNIADPEHNTFNLLVSLVAVGEIVAVALGIVALRRWRRERPNMWWPLFIWATTTTLLMLSVTNVFWEYLPKLKFVQLPWRWLVPLNVVFAITVAAAVRRKSGRVVVFALIAVWMFTLSSRVLPPWWDTAQDVEAIHRSIVKGAGYEGTDEYVPRGADPYEIKSDAARVEILSPATGNVNIKEWRAESRAFTVDVSQPAQLALKLFNYPAWRVEVNGCAIETATRDVTGQMLISVPAGASEVAVRFTRTRDRKVGIAVSAVTGLLLIVIGVIGARSRREPKLNR